MSHTPTAGSPPRMRGKRSTADLLLGWVGITPADAGKTCLLISLNASAKDHPRGCGENRLSIFRSRYIGGSPPRMRGKQTYMGYSFFNDRITPADAGKTRNRSRRCRSRWDHPRGCGENRPTSRRLMVSRGSPPRMRGKHFHANAAPWADGITPADAGKTRIQILRGGQHQDHPRGCGENWRLHQSGATRLGSPPRMRGKPSLHVYAHGFYWITPADAGKTVRGFDKV